MIFHSTMATCPKCNVSYGADVRWCPSDGSQLETTAAAGSAVFDNPTSFSKARTLPGHAPGAAPLGPGSRIGEYEITSKLGEGGMGVVYAGVQPLIGKKVAVKVLNPLLSQDASMEQRFIQEARSVNQIGHRNIVDIFSFGQLPSGQHYFVMELLPGQTLASRLGQPVPPTYEEGFNILLEVCEALIAAHAEGIVHRDLKPDNIYLAQGKTGPLEVKLLDFGIAKLMHGGQAVGQTGTGVPMGTPLYMSPEQCRGADVDARTDIYALGVIMFEMFTGRLPFKKNSYIETVTAHLTELPPRPAELAELPPGLEPIIFACLEKDPDARPWTMATLRDQLQKVASQNGVWFDRRMSSVHTAIGAVHTPSHRTPPPAGSTATPTTNRSATMEVVVPRRWGGIAAVIAGAALLGIVGAGVALRQRRPPPPAVAPALDLQVVSNPEGAVVLLDGKRQALRTPSLFHVARAPSVRVRIEKLEFSPWEETVAIGADERERSIEVTLQPLKVAGALEVRTNVTEASWKLDGQPAGDGTGAFKRDELSPGPHTLSVEAPGFLPRQESLLVKPQQLATLEWILTAAPAAHHAHREAPAHPSAKPAGKVRVIDPFAD
jgi:serine/threonine-protein kinase